MNIFLRAYDVIDVRGWYQGDYEAADGRVCLVGALNVAVSGQAQETLLDGDAEEAVCEAVERVSGLLWNDGVTVPDIAWWNDKVAQSEEEPKLLLKRAAVELEAEEAG